MGKHRNKNGKGILGASGEGSGGYNEFMESVAKINAENVLAWMKPKQVKESKCSEPKNLQVNKTELCVDSDVVYESDDDNCGDFEEQASDEENEKLICAQVEMYLKSTSILPLSGSEPLTFCLSEDEFTDESSPSSPAARSTSSRIDEEDENVEFYAPYNWLIEKEELYLPNEETEESFDDLKIVLPDAEFIRPDVPESDIKLEVEEHNEISNEESFHPENSEICINISEAEAESEPSELSRDESHSHCEDSTSWIKRERKRSGSTSSVSTICLDNSDDENKSKETEVAKKSEGKSEASRKLKEASESVNNKHKRYGYEKIRHTPARPKNNDYRKAEWVCPYCDKTFTYGSRFMHLQRKHDGIRHLCKFCNMGFKRRTTMKTHRLRVHPLEVSRKYNCLYCINWYVSRDTLERHVKLIHPKTKPFHSHACVVCDKIFLTNNELGDHYKEHLANDGGVFKCKLCEKVYLRADTLRNHMVVKHNPKGELRYKCDTCDSAFLTYYKLNSHRKTHENSEDRDLMKRKQQGVTCTHITPAQEKSRESTVCDKCGIVCTYCRGIFQTKQSFFLHTHKLCCGICRMRFRNGSDYNFHSAYHEPPDVICFRCEVCKFGFVTVGSLNIHSVKMHGLKMSFPNYKCLKCDKVFGKKELLSIHLKTHSPNIKCPWCRKKFTTVTCRDHHLMRVHTMERPFRCKKCKKGYVRNTDLTKHNLEVHDENYVRKPRVKKKPKKRS